MRISSALAIVWLGLAGPTFAKEYVLVGSYGNRLHLVDPVNMKVARSYQLPGPGTGPSEIVPSPDGRVAYALTNRWTSVSGIDLDTGKEVFRADLSNGDVKAHSLFGLDISPDGRRLYVYEQRYRQHTDRFEVLQPSIAVYRTDAGTDAKPERLIPTERQIQHLAVSSDGKTLFAHGLDMYVIDEATGKLRGTLPVANWQRPGYGPADAMAWLGEQLNSSHMYALGFYADRSAPQGSPPARDVGVMELDLRKGTLSLDVIGPDSEAPGLSSMSVDPQDPNIVVGLGPQLVKIDVKAKRVLARAPTNGLLFYVTMISADGQRVYAGGGHCRVGIYSMHDLSQLGLVELPNCTVMAQSSLRLVNR